MVRVFLLVVYVFLTGCHLGDTELSYDHLHLQVDNYFNAYFDSSASEAIEALKNAEKEVEKWSCSNSNSEYDSYLNFDRVLINIRLCRIYRYLGLNEEADLRLNLAIKANDRILDDSYDTKGKSDRQIGQELLEQITKLDDSIGQPIWMEED